MKYLGAGYTVFSYWVLCEHFHNLAVAALSFLESPGLINV